MDEVLIARFWAKVDRGGPDDCWPWVGASRRGGYGCIKLPRTRRVTSAARLSMEIAGIARPLLPGAHGAVVIHSCDNPSCVNPAHLSYGSQRENLEDMTAKGRRGKR